MATGAGSIPFLAMASRGVATYAYDGDGVRVGQTVNGTTTHYVNDTNRALPVLLTEGTTKDVWGPAGLAERVDSQGNVQAPLTDGLGSVRALTDGAGNVVQTMLTDAFGDPANPAGSQGTASQPFGFTGQPTDPLGLVDLRARVYSPALGRFLQRDPAAGNIADPLSLNRFTYARNNPTSLTDPSGLTPLNKVLQGGDDTCNNPLSALYCGIVNPILGPGGLLSMLPGIFHGQGDGGGGGGSTFRGPAAKGFDWEHILARHSEWGDIAAQRANRDQVFQGMNTSQIKAAVQAAWRNRERVGSQTDPITGIVRVRYQGVDPVSGLAIELWQNQETRVVETAYPLR